VRFWWLLWVVVLGVACAPDPLRLEAEAVMGGVEVRASAPLDRVEVFDEVGHGVAARTLPRATPQVLVLLPWAPGRHYVLRAASGGRVARTGLDTPSLGRVRVALAAPLGQEQRPVADGDQVPVTLLVGESVEVAVLLTAVEPGVVHVRWGGAEEEVTLHVPGERATVLHTLAGGRPVEVSVETEDEALRFSLRPQVLSMEEARRLLRVVAVRLPADSTGHPDLARPPDRVSLPSAWWGTLLHTLHLGYRPRDEQAPWTRQAVVLENRGDEPLNVAVSARVVDAEGRPAVAFRSRVREADTVSGAVSVLVRIPPGERARATLPFFVDRTAVAEGAYQRLIEVTPLGSTVPLHRVERPLYVGRGSPWASLGFGMALLASLGGLVLLVRRGPRWLRALNTAELMTIALFGSLTFVVAAAARLLGYGIASVLGPFSPLVTGLIDDAFRTCLLAALVVLVPRVGVVAFASLVGYLMRGLALGSFHPADLLYFGSVVCFLEGCLWLSGLTRHQRWLDEGRVARWLRMSLGFGVANALSVAAGLVVTVVLYRLFLADWYVAMMLILPGFLYVVAGCWLAVRFAESLRKVTS